MHGFSVPLKGMLAAGSITKALQLLTGAKGRVTCGRLLTCGFLCRAQVVLAAAQSPLLGDKAQAAQLIPRLCSVILTAPSHCRHVSLAYALLQSALLAWLAYACRLTCMSCQQHGWI